MSGATIAVMMSAVTYQYDAGGGGNFSDLDPFNTGGAEVDLVVNADGTASIASASGGVLASWHWSKPAYLSPLPGRQVEVAVTSGAFTSGSAVNTSLALSSNRAWQLVSTGPGQSVAFTLKLRDQSGTVLASDSYVFTADAA